MESIFDLYDEELIDISNSWYHVTVLSKSGKVWDTKEIVEKDYYNLELNEYMSEKCVIEIKCSSFYTLALTKSGEVYAWGPRYSMHFRNNSQNDSKPVRINGFDGEKIRMISCGFMHSLALTKNGYVYGWGNNKSGQLGFQSDNHLFQRLGNLVHESGGFEQTPKKINIANVFIEKVSCGSSHSLLLSTEGHIYVFGENNKIQLGNIYLRKLSPPFKLNISGKYSDIASHSFHDFSVALSTNGIYYIWGEFDNKVYEEPTPTDFSSLDEIYAKFLVRPKTFN